MSDEGHRGVDLVALTDAIERGDRAVAISVTRSAIDAEVDPAVILAAMTAAMETVGRRFQCSEIFVPEMLISARAMKESMALLEPLLAGAGVEPEFTAILGTVKGDLHDIGKNLVATMWRGAGLAVVDLGTNVSPEAFAAAAVECRARIVGVSALLTTTMTGMRDVVTALRATGLDLAVLAGGAPLTAEYAAQIGADGYAPDAASAVDVALGLARARQGDVAAS